VPESVDMGIGHSRAGGSGMEVFAPNARLEKMMKVAHFLEAPPITAPLLRNMSHAVSGVLASWRGILLKRVCAVKSRDVFDRFS